MKSTTEMGVKNLTLFGSLSLTSGKWRKLWLPPQESSNPSLPGRIEKEF